MYVNTKPQARFDPETLPDALRAKTVPQVEEELKTPFSAQEVKWRAGATNKANTRALALAYIDARVVEDRLDDVFGPTGWWDDYGEGPQGGVKCYLTVVYPNGMVITKTGLAPNTDVESVKGGESDALKRAAVKFGIARYLYNLPNEWVGCEKRGRSVVLVETPDLPQWATPNGNQPGRESNGKSNGKTAFTSLRAVHRKPQNGKAAKTDKSPAAERGDPGNYVVPFGKYEGKKLSALSSKVVRWYAHTMEPKGKGAEALQAAARAYAKGMADGNGNGNGNGGAFVVSFGKNQGKKLSELPPETIQWYAEEMEPINEQGQALQTAARAFVT